MAAELSQAADRGEGDGALAVLHETLATIAEREDAGYITEAMVQHRLRLIALAGERFAEEDVQGRGIAWAADERVLGPAVSNQGLRVRVVLHAHGETTEVVRGRDKLLRASFRLGMEVENLAAAEVRVGVPSIEGSVAFPIERWYVVGGSGERWDGVLAAYQKQWVNVIGYLGEPVKPASIIDARVRFESLTLQASTRAAAHWSEGITATR